MNSADSDDTPSREAPSALILHDVLGSATAGIVSRIVTHPLDTVKARLQTTQTTFHSPIDALVRTYRHEGIRALYGGFGAVFWAGTPATVVYLTSYSYFRGTLSNIALGLQIAGGSSADEGNKSTISHGQEFVVHFMSGMLAEAVCCVIYVPVDVVKERLQIQQQQRNVPNNGHNPNYQYNGSFDALRQIIKTEGIRGIYKGYGATLASFGPFSALYFMFYEQCKALSREYIDRQNNTIGINVTPPIKDGDLTLFHLIACSSGAGALASWLTSPLDMAKLRLQVQRGQAATTKGSNNQTKVLQHRNMLDCLRSAYREGGVKGLFRGAGARVIHFVPATTITMTGYEKFRAFYADALG